MEQLPEEVKKEHKTTRNINGGLDLFQLKPPDMKGIELFDCMIKHRKVAGNVEAEEPGNYLTAEMSKDQKYLILNLSNKDFARRELMKDAGGTRATAKLAKRKLDNLGHIKVHSGLANDPVKIGQMKRAAMLEE